VTVFAVHAFADDAKMDKSMKMDKMDKGKAGSWSGELVDMGCYVGSGATGEKHGMECGTKCVANGMPMGLLTKGKVVVLTMAHDNADPYNACKAWVGKMVEVSGTLASRGGVSAITVTGSKPAATK
jgi:hypothetical protein